MSARSKSAVGQLVTTAFSLLLMLWGWGWDDVRGFFSDPARAGTVAVLLLGAFYLLLRFPDVNLFGKGQEVRGRGLLKVWALLGFFLLWFLPYADRHGGLVFAAGDDLRYFGLFLQVVGGTVRVAALSTLGRQFSGYVTLQENHQLVETGLYSKIRHPMYLGLLVAMPGFLLVFRSNLVLPMLVLTGGFVWLRMRQEEGLLRDKFGAAFDEYAKRTSRLIPHVY
jgi:protein-S-isoprenylcysteine O-methyltransferase Ste14